MGDECRACRWRIRVIPCCRLAISEAVTEAVLQAGRGAASRVTQPQPKPETGGCHATPDAAAHADLPAGHATQARGDRIAQGRSIAVGQPDDAPESQVVPLADAFSAGDLRSHRSGHGDSVPDSKCGGGLAQAQADSGTF
jgi:hypothetical protein